MATSPLHHLAPFSTDHQAMAVLLVDDDAEMVELSSLFLEREMEDISTTTFTDPENALASLCSGEYDCIVSDFDMPQMDGLELLRQVRKRDISIPFVLFTGKGSEEIASRAISEGVDEYLQKGGPEEYPVLANKVENLVEKHWAENQVQRGFLALESAEEGIGIIDKDGIYRYVNDAYAKIYNRDRTELIGEHWDMLYPAEEAQRFHDEILPQLETTGSWQGVSTGVTKEGDEVPERLVLTQMSDGGHVCIVQEQTNSDELRAELALKNNALDAAGLGVIIIDVTQEHNLIVYHNDGFEQLTGYDETAITGSNYLFLQGEESDSDSVAEIRRAVEARESVSTELLSYTLDGASLQTSFELYPVQHDERPVTHFIGFLRESPNQQASEAELKGQLHWLREFGDVLSHDMKTPLSIVKSNIQLARELEDVDRLDAALEAADRIEELIDDLATVLTRGELVTDPVAVELADAFRSWEAFDTKPELLTVEDSKPIIADEDALVRLADNLVKNTVEHAGEDVPIRIGTLADGFYYEDGGPGIPPEKREDVFKPGFTTKEDGTGFGMVSIKQIALAHGWQIDISESDEGGARFEFTSVTEGGM